MEARYSIHWYWYICDRPTDISVQLLHRLQWMSHQHDCNSFFKWKWKLRHKNDHSHWSWMISELNLSMSMQCYFVFFTIACSLCSILLVISSGENIRLWLFNVGINVSSSLWRSNGDWLLRKFTKGQQRTRTHLHFDYTVFATLVPLSPGT